MPAVIMLPPITLPVALINPPVLTLAAVMLPVALIAAPVMSLVSALIITAVSCAKTLPTNCPSKNGALARVVAFRLLALTLAVVWTLPKRLARLPVYVGR